MFINNSLILALAATLYFHAYSVYAWIEYADTGTATMTHYEIGKDTVAACGCVGGSSDSYPTAAMSQMAYGSSRAYGPACGRCFNLTLLNTWTPNPPFYPDQSKYVVVKITDLCPLSESGWCSGTEEKTNPFVHLLPSLMKYLIGPTAQRGAIPQF
jgi:hypothetical protein